LALSLAEREEISRGVVACSSMRAMAGTYSHDESYQVSHETIYRSLPLGQLRRISTKLQSCRSLSQQEIRWNGHLSAAPAFAGGRLLRS